VQIAGERAECAHRPIVSIGIDRRHVHGRTNVDGCRAWHNHRHIAELSGF
jgi:hypothetical protein